MTIPSEAEIEIYKVKHINAKLHWNVISKAAVAIEHLC